MDYFRNVNGKNEHIVSLVENPVKMSATLLDNELVEQVLEEVDVDKLTKIAIQGRSSAGLIAVLCFELWRHGRLREIYDLNAKLIGRDLLEELEHTDQLPLVCAVLYQEHNVSALQIDSMLNEIIEILYKSKLALSIDDDITSDSDIEAIDLEKSKFMMNFAVRNLRYFSEMVLK